jgi:hypothetical protein
MKDDLLRKVEKRECEAQKSYASMGMAILRQGELEAELADVQAELASLQSKKRPRRKTTISPATHFYDDEDDEEVLDTIEDEGDQDGEDRRREQRGEGHRHNSRARSASGDYSKNMRFVAGGGNPPSSDDDPDSDGDDKRGDKRGKIPKYRDPKFRAQGYNSTPISQTPSTLSGRKSAKVDVPRFFDDPSEDKVTFDVWYHQMENKLRVNADHYDDDKAKFGEVFNRLGGSVADNVLPFLDKTHPDRLRTSKQLLGHLWEAYHDHNAHEKAVHEFQMLYMKTSEAFKDFKVKFVRLAGQRRCPKEQWKPEMRRRLTSYLRSLSETTYLSESSFEQYCKLLQSLDEGKRMNDNSNGWKSGMSTKDNSSTSASNTSRRTMAKAANPEARKTNSDYTKPSNGLSGGSFAKRPSDDELKRLHRLGLCFACKKPGHLTTACPEKNKHDRALDARIAEIANQTWGDSATEVEESAEEDPHDPVEELVNPDPDQGN